MSPSRLRRNDQTVTESNHAFAPHLMKALMEHKDEKEKEGNSFNLSIPYGLYYDVAPHDWPSYAPNDRESHQSGINTLSELSPSSH